MTTSSEFKAQILTKASENAEFRASLLDDPAAAVGAELNAKISDTLQINVHEDGPNVVNLVLPPKVQLGETELENVHGGMPTHYWD